MAECDAGLGGGGWVSFFLEGGGDRCERGGRGKGKGALRVGSDSELGTPFFGDYFGEAGYACFGHAVVYLTAGGERVNACCSIFLFFFLLGGGGGGGLLTRCH